MQNNHIKYFTLLLWICFLFLNSCKKEGPTVDDYLPLKPGARYKYNYLETDHYVYETSTWKGVSTWTFLPQTAGAPNVYLVEESFTGDIADFGYGPPTKDSTRYENKISTFGFQVQSDGIVVFTYHVPDWNSPLKRIPANITAIPTGDA